jgi:hypothetical protein
MNASPSIIQELALFVLLFGVPVLVFLPRLKPGVGAFTKRVFISTAATWLALALFVWFIGLPSLRAVGDRIDAQERLARYWIVVYGCIPAMIGTTITAVAFSIIRYVRKKGRTTAEP